MNPHISGKCMLITFCELQTQLSSGRLGTYAKTSIPTIQNLSHLLILAINDSNMIFHSREVNTPLVIRLWRDSKIVLQISPSLKNIFGFRTWGGSSNIRYPNDLKGNAISTVQYWHTTLGSLYIISFLLLVNMWYHTWLLRQCRQRFEWAQCPSYLLVVLLNKIREME